MKIKCFSRYLELQKSVTKNLQGKAVICHINYWDQVNSWKKVWKFRNDPLCRNKSSPFPLLNVAEYLQSSNTEACAKNLSQILTNNIDNRERGIGLRIDVRYYRFLTLALLKVRYCQNLTWFITVYHYYVVWNLITSDMLSRNLISSSKFFRINCYKHKNCQVLYIGGN